VQPDTDECIQCGVLVARYRPDSQRPKALTPEELEPTVDEPTEPDPLKRQIRPPLRFVRSGAGVIGLALGSWLFLAGQSLELKPAHVLFMIAYACISLFWVLSVFVRVPVRQFAFEMLIFVIATLGLRIALPEAFSLGTLSNQSNGPYVAGEGDVAPEPVDFNAKMEKLADQARNVLQDLGERELSDRWLEDCRTLKVTYRGLSADQRRTMEAQYKSLVALEARLEAVRSTPEPDRELVEAAFRAVEELEKLLVEAGR
jgi:hypothetical protein